MKTTITYAVIYPQGTGYSYRLFSDRAIAEKFLDSEANHTYIILPDDREITFGIIEGKTPEEIEEIIIERKMDEDGEFYNDDYAKILYSLLNKSEDVAFFRNEKGETDDDNAPSQYLTI